MSFTDQKFLLFLFILIPFLLIAIYNFRRKRNIIRNLFSLKAYRELNIRSGRETDIFKTVLITISFLFLILAMAGPQWGEKYEKLEIKGKEMLFLLDTSYSMNAEDLKPDRLSLAKLMIKRIVDGLRTDYVGLINFAGSAYVQCPMTIDYEVFKLFTDASDISPESEQGTDFYEALNLALKKFNSSPGGERVLFFITDGEDLENRWEKLVEKFVKNKIIIFTIGVGSLSGAPIPLKDSSGNITGWKKDKNGNIVKSRLNEKILMKIASDTGGIYFRITDSNGVGILLNNLKKIEMSVLKKKLKTFKISRYQYPLFIGIMFLLTEMVLTSKKILWKRK